MKWISVDERLPHPDEKVLAWCPDFFHQEKPIVFARYNPRARHAWRPEGTNGGPWRVTHWMPLPPPPGDEQ